VTISVPPRRMFRFLLMKHSFNLSKMFLINENMINNYKLVKETVFLEWNTKEDILKNVGN